MCSGASTRGLPNPIYVSDRCLCRVRCTIGMALRHKAMVRGFRSQGSTANVHLMSPRPQARRPEWVMVVGEFAAASDFRSFSSSRRRAPRCRGGSPILVSSPLGAARNRVLVHIYIYIMVPVCITVPTSRREQWLLPSFAPCLLNFRDNRGLCFPESKQVDIAIHENGHHVANAAAEASHEILCIWYLFREQGAKR